MSEPLHSEPLHIFVRPWFRMAHWIAAVSGLAVFLYVLATGAGPRQSVLLMGSSVAMLWSLLAFRRELWGIAIILSVQAVIFLAWSLIALVQDS